MCWEKICSWHKNPANAFLHGIAFIIFIIALWQHSFWNVLLALLVAFLGHVIQAQSEGKKVRRKK